MVMVRSKGGVVMVHSKGGVVMVHSIREEVWLWYTV